MSIFALQANADVTNDKNGAYKSHIIENTPCSINIPDTAGTGIELQQLPAILEMELLSYYDSCDEKPAASLSVLLTGAEKPVSYTHLTLPTKA